MPSFARICSTAASTARPMIAALRKHCHGHGALFLRGARPRASAIAGVVILSSGSVGVCCAHQHRATKVCGRVVASPCHAATVHVARAGLRTGRSEDSARASRRAAYVRDPAGFLRSCAK